MLIMKKHLQIDNLNLAFNRNKINNNKKNFLNQFKTSTDKIPQSTITRKRKLNLINVIPKLISKKSKKIFKMKRE